MTQRQLIAITRPQEKLPTDMHAVSTGDLAAIFVPLVRTGRLTRRRALRAAAQRQRYLEQLLPTGAVLPVLPGQHLAPSDAARMLCANSSTLSRKLTEVENKIQYQIMMSIDESHALQQLSGPEGPFEAAEDLEGLKRLMIARLEDRLDACTCDRTALPIANGLMLNLVVLVDIVSEAAFHDAIAEVDAFWPSGINFRVIGPSPAVSFASVAFQKTSRADLALAFEILRLDGPSGASSLSRARARALREAHASVEQIRLAADIVASADKLREEDAFPFYRVRFWAEGTSSTNYVSLRRAA